MSIKTDQPCMQYVLTNNINFSQICIKIFLNKFNNKIFDKNVFNISIKCTCN